MGQILEENNAPVVSVLMLTYQQEKTVRQAIDSVLSQKCDFSFELLVGDDHSEDGTPALIAAAAEADPRVIPILREQNIGSTQNLYDLQMRARGAYLAYLDGDDYYCDPHKLQKQVTFLRQNDAYIACTHEVVIVDKDGREIPGGLRWVSPSAEYSLSDFHGIMLPGHISSLMHRNIFTSCGDAYQELITAHPMIGDRPLMLLLAAQGKIRRLPDRMSCYRHESGQERGATALFYSENENRTQEDYAFTCRLEALAQQALGAKCDFSIHKSELFVSAVWDWLRTPSSARAKLVGEILRDGDPVKHLLRTPRIVVKKFADRMNRRT